VLNLGTLDQAIEEGRLPAGAPIDEAALKAAGVVKTSSKLAGVRLLAKGEIKRAVTLTVTGASAAAIAAVQAAGGTVTTTAPAETAEA
jgi:large subunit ribosomal protein L15